MAAHSSPAPLGFLEQLLRSRLSVRDIGWKRFGKGPATLDEIITTNRFILVLQGELNYTVEGRTARREAGTQFFVPAWVRRVWSVPRRAPCEIIWCEFDDEGDESDRPAGYFRKLRGDALAKEEAHYRELLDLWRRHKTSGPHVFAAALLEGELKAMLARFWAGAEEPSRRKAKIHPSPRRPMHPQIKTALRWIKDHYQEPEALAGLYRKIGMTPNYFRNRFQAELRCSPQDYLQRLRLRRARYLLYTTDMLLKQIAMEVGYNDPRYFSRLYRRFWKHSPRQDRR